MTATFDAVIKHHITETGRTNGYISFINPVYVDLSIAERFRNGEKVTITIRTRRKARSLPQNAYLHLALQMIAEETGNSLDSVKSTLKAMYAKKPLLDKDGDPIYDSKTGEQAFYIQDTSDMDTQEAAQFTENVKMFAIDFCNLVIPEPNEQIDFKFK